MQSKKKQIGDDQAISSGVTVFFIGSKNQIKQKFAHLT
jgi:hypothetical protein